VVNEVYRDYGPKGCLEPKSLHRLVLAVLASPIRALASLWR